MNAVFLLAANAAAQFVFASLLGFLMLLPMQPWARGLGAVGRVLRSKAMTAAHVDWLMLASMQIAAAFLLDRFPIATTAARTAAWTLVLGGWINPLAYVFRATGIDAFVLAGPPRQLFASSMAAASALAITVGWSTLLVAALSK